MLDPKEQCRILSNSVVNFINEEELLKKLKQKKVLKIKAGFDPSKPDIHLGHSLLINKLREFQELGHEVFFVVGDFTACIGDPSGQNKTRPILSFDEAKKNSQTYINQTTKKSFTSAKKTDTQSQKLFSFFKRLDPKKTRYVFNSTWLSKLDLKTFILSVCSKMTVASQMERNDFALRYKLGKSIGLHEFVYPVLQAYDSVELQADVEIGGTDQLFNFCLARDLQKSFKQESQVVMTLPLLEGLDGSKKMSKSLNNAISFNDSPKEMYGKIMKISDDLLFRYWDMFTQNTSDLKKQVLDNKINPKNKKEELAWILICSFYGEKQADMTQSEFSRIFSHKGLPDNIPQKILNSGDNICPCKTLKDLGLCQSIGEAKRFIQAGAVKKDGIKQEDYKKKWNLKSQDTFLLSLGKRKFIQVKVR